MSEASVRQVSDDILYSGSSFSAAIVIALQSTFSSCASCTLCSTLHIVIAPSPLLVYVALCATRAPNMMINLYVGGLLLARLAGSLQLIVVATAPRSGLPSSPSHL